MALIALEDVSKTWDANWPLLRGVSLTVRDDDRIGLIGANGSGKSTLLAILAGTETPDEGERVARRGLRIGVLEQEPRFEPTRSVREVVREGLAGRDELVAELAGVHDALAAPGLDGEALARLLRRQEGLEGRLEALGGHDVEHLVEAVVAGVGLPDPEAACGVLSGGESRRAALARLLVSAPDLLLLDEPTNHLDAFVIAWLEEHLARLRLPLVLVTHDRYLLDRVVDRIVELDRGRLHEYAGGYARYVELRAERLAAEEHAERTRLGLLRRETEWMRRGPLARTTKAKARVARYEELVDGARDAPAPELELAIPPGPRLGARVVALRGVSHAYDGATVLPRLDLELEAGQRLGVVGPNGAGKTTLIRILTGELRPTSGVVEVGSTVCFGQVDQRRSDLDPDKTVVEEVAGASDWVQVADRPVHVASFLETFLFPGARKHVRVGALSGGERGRVLLAKLLLAGANVLVLDEPTNDLDLATLRALEEALLGFPGTVVVVSHDRWFLDRVATHVLYLDGAGGARLHTGDASSLLAKLAAERDTERDTERGTGRRARIERAGGAAPARSPARSKGLAPWERRELERLTERVAELETALAAVDARLADPALYAGPASDARAVQAERAEASRALDEAMARWEELAERDG